MKTTAMGLSAFLITAAAHAQTRVVLTGQQAFTDYKGQAPGVIRHLTVADLPEPGATESVNNGPAMVPRPDGAMPQVPPGFQVELAATGLDNPREIKVAPDGDLFVAESETGKLRVFHGVDK